MNKTNPALNIKAWANLNINQEQQSTSPQHEDTIRLLSLEQHETSF